MYSTIILTAAMSIVAPATTTTTNPERAIVVVLAATPAPRATNTQRTIYCLREQRINSRTWQKRCQSRAAWLADGFDPLDPQR